MEYLLAASFGLARPPVLWGTSPPSSHRTPGDVAEALGFKKLGGETGPADLKKRAAREDAETLLAFLLALRLGQGVKRSAAVWDVARYAAASESTVGRAWRRAGQRGRRMLGALLCYGNALTSATLKRLPGAPERTPRDFAFGVHFALVQMVIRSLHGHWVQPDFLSGGDSEFAPNSGVEIH